MFVLPGCGDLQKRGNAIADCMMQLLLNASRAPTEMNELSRYFIGEMQAHFVLSQYSNVFHTTVFQHCTDIRIAIAYLFILACSLVADVSRVIASHIAAYEVMNV